MWLWWLHHNDYTNCSGFLSILVFNYIAHFYTVVVVAAGGGGGGASGSGGGGASGGGGGGASGGGHGGDGDSGGDGGDVAVVNISAVKGYLEMITLHW